MSVHLIPYTDHEAYLHLWTAATYSSRFAPVCVQPGALASALSSTLTTVGRAQPCLGPIRETPLDETGRVGVATAANGQTLVLVRAHSYRPEELAALTRLSTHAPVLLLPDRGADLPFAPAPHATVNALDVAAHDRREPWPCH